MAERLGFPVDPRAAWEAHYRAMAEFSRHRLDGSDMTWDWWLERYFTLLGHPEPASAGRAIDRGYGLWTWPIPGVGEHLGRLRGEGVRLAVVSNSDGSVEGSLEEAGLAGLFETVIDSHLAGVGKPDPAIFHLALDRLEVDPESAWYVGDSVFHDVGGARAAGLAGSWLIDPLGLHLEAPHRVRSVSDLRYDRRRGRIVAIPPYPAR